MKIFFITKKKIMICFAIILAIIIALILPNFFRTEDCVAAELTSNSEVSANFLDNVKNLAKGEEKIAYLTFDDGPTASITPKILDILKEEDIKATFFCYRKICRCSS